jgi:hypothetical protein
MDSEAGIPGQGQSERRIGIPGVANIQIRRAHFDPPIRFYSRGELVSRQDAIELLVQTTAAMPIRDDTPVLFIGDVEVGDYDLVALHTYRFRTFDLDRLERGARISIGWPSARPSARIATPFVFDPGVIPVA